MYTYYYIYSTYKKHNYYRLPKYINKKITFFFKIVKYYYKNVCDFN